MKISLARRLATGRRVLCGEKPSVLANELGVSRETVTRCAEEFLYSLRDFNAQEYLRMRTPGLGHLRAAIALYKTIRERAAPAEPELVWHFGLRPALTRSLSCAGLESREQVLQAYREGRIGALCRPKRGAKNLHKLGRKSMEQIAAWLDEDPHSQRKMHAGVNEAIALLESHGYRVVDSQSEG
jgi:hypothetical protein